MAQMINRFVMNFSPSDVLSKEEKMANIEMIANAKFIHQEFFNRIIDLSRRRVQRAVCRWQTKQT